MIVLDTNVVSEPLRPRPDPAVLHWLRGLDEPVAITAVTQGELLAGAYALPYGRRRSALIDAIETILAAEDGRVLPYDALAARRYAQLLSSNRAVGRALSTEDGMIAAICSVHAATLATRNVIDFAGLGLTVIDPWNTPVPAGPKGA